MDFLTFIDNFNTVMQDNGLSVFAQSPIAERFFQLTEHMLSVNEKMNLTAIKDEGAIILKHYADSLTAAEFLPQNAFLLDVGCGAGFPTLPLGLCRPDLRLHALDSTEKKVNYVRETAQMLEIPLVTRAARAEEVAHGPWRESFDVCVARAVAALPVLAELCLPFVRVGGTFLAMKASRAAEELESARKAIARLGGEICAVHERSLYDRVTDTHEPRTLIEIKKVIATPSSYPRAYAKIVRSPL